MILVVALVVVLVAVAGAGLLGIGVFSGDDGRRRGPGAALAALSVPVLVIVAVGVFAVLALGVVGMGGGAEHEPEGTPAAPADGTPAVTSVTATTRVPAANAPSPLPGARLQPVETTLTVVAIRADEEDRFSTNQPVGGIVPGAAVRVRAEGFGEFELGYIDQCVAELGRQTGCRGAFPVQFDLGGRADFQFAVSGDFAPGGCRVGRPTCLLRLTGSESKRRGTTQTVFVDPFVPGRVEVEPRRGPADGETVEVSVTGFPAGASAAAVLCAPPEAYNAGRCSPAGAGSTFAVDAGGGGRTTLVVTTGRLGSGTAGCGPRQPCGVVVVVGDGFVAARPVPIAFSLGPGVSYEAGRIVPGLAVALVLVVVVMALALRTDWTKPTEAATPDLDHADLQSDRTLDEIFGTDEEIDERDPIPG